MASVSLLFLYHRRPRPPRQLGGFPLANGSISPGHIGRPGLSACVLWAMVVLRIRGQLQWDFVLVQGDRRNHDISIQWYPPIPFFIIAANDYSTVPGTSVAVVGTYDIGGSCNTTFSIDGTQTQVTNPTLKAPENHKTIWSSETLPDGEHTLVYSIQSCTSDPSSSSGLSLWFDYVLYTPSPSSPGRVRYFTDDSDSRIRYSGSWKTSNENEDFGHSKHGGVKGDSLTYEFYGELPVDTTISSL